MSSSFGVSRNLPDTEKRKHENIGDAEGDNCLAPGRKVPLLKVLEKL